jgi:hypothetical protein
MISKEGLLIQQSGSLVTLVSVHEAYPVYLELSRKPCQINYCFFPQVALQKSNMLPLTSERINR